ncbi:MAG: acyl carrier protein [Dinghuibacter sp.]|nr:acyl carrier protein [Dinghuibacter sp.]
MNRSELREQLKELISPYVSDKTLLNDVTDSTHLVHDLKINSAHFVDVILDTESKFNISIEDELADKMFTVGDCLNIIEGKLAANAGG